MEHKVKTIIVAIPTKETLYSEFALSLRLLRIPEGCQAAFAMNKKAARDASRNEIVDAMPPETDYVFYLEDNILLPSDALERFMKHDKDIVTGIYFRTVYPFYPAIYKNGKGGKPEPYFEFPKDTLTEIDACEAGCMLVKADVFRKMKRPWFRGGEFEGGFSDDINFCAKAKEAGYKIFCDTGVRAAHMSAGPIDWRTWDAIKERAIEEHEKAKKG